MTDRPKVSVLIPTYRYARFLPEAIDSVLEQDFRDFELLISDDGSRDGSAELIRRYAAADPRIRFEIHENNLGMVANWNWCLGQARGEYVKFVFGDDKLMSPTTLGRMVAMLEKNPGAVLAATARAILDERSRTVALWSEWPEPGLHRGSWTIARCLTEDRNLIGEPSAVLFRRAAAARGFDAAWRQVVDQEMWFHLLRQGDFVCDPTPLCAFRRHGAQQTEANLREHIGSTEGLLLAARYLGYYADSIDVAPGCLQMKRFLFRRIYYARKERCLTPLRAAAEALLMERLTRPWYFACWLMHRVMKPFTNLRRHFWPRGDSKA